MFSSSSSLFISPLFQKTKMTENNGTQIANNNKDPAKKKDEKNDNNDNKKKEKNPEDETNILPMVQKFGKLFGCMMFGYMIGYTNMSTWWLSVAAFMWIVRDKNRLLQQRRLDFERAVAQDEKNIVKYAVQDLPCWVVFPDTERAEWINRIFKQMWPFLGEYVKTLLKTKVEQNIDQVMPDFCKGFRFEKIDLGTVPLRLGSVKCYDENTSRDEIIMDLELIYAGNCDIQVRIKGLNAGIKDFQLYGILRVELKPLIKDMPLIGCMSFYFIKNPVIEFNFTNIADVLDFPGLSEFLRNAIKEQISKMMVLPNKFVCPMIKDLKSEVIKFAQPLGLVRLEVIEARHLKKADVGMLGLGKSDPYVNIIIGNQEFKTPTIKNTINPKWSFICETLAYFSTQSIDLEVMDEDQGSKDDFLGRFSFPIESIMNDGVIDAWVNLKDTKTGRIHVKATWLKLTHDMAHVSLQSLESKELKKEYSHQTGVPFGSTACLLIYLDSAKNLPTLAKAIGEPSPQVVFRLGQQTEKSIVKTFTCNPVWEENFSFLISHFNQNDELYIDIFDTKSNRKIGETSFPLQTLIGMKNMTYSNPLTIRSYNYSFELHCIFSLYFTVSPNIQKVRLVREETVEETENIPAMEDLVRGTVEPIAKIGGLDADVLELAQKQQSQQQQQNNNQEAFKNMDLHELGREVEAILEHNKAQCDDNASIANSIASSTSNQQLFNQSNSPMLKVTIGKIEDMDEPKWEIIAHKARNLPLINDRTPDSYVKIYTVPDRFRSKQDKRNKSVTIKHTRNPVYEERFLLDLDQELESARLVVLSRSDGLFNKKKTPIGSVVINFSDYLDSELPLTQWFELDDLEPEE